MSAKFTARQWYTLDFFVPHKENRYLSRSFFVVVVVVVSWQYSHIGL